MDLTVIETIEQVKEDICTDYCKMPELYLSMYDDPDDAHDYMIVEKCEGCPLQQL